MNNLVVDRKALENFVLDNPDLERLEAQISQFNIFDAIGVIRQELRHSDFLAFLLDPKQNHGLHDNFLKRFLMYALQDFNSSLSLIDIEMTNFSQTIVMREWQNIDILITDEKSRLVVAIENKVDTNEHDNQLSRYRSIVQNRYTDYQQIFIYLTPDERLPTDEEDRLIYIPLSYRSIARVVELILETKSVSLNDDIRTLLKHYLAMLRRHIVSDSDIAELCRKIYQTHKQAIDLIIEHLPNLQQEISAYCLKLLKTDSQFIHESKVKRAILFGFAPWDTLSPLMLQGPTWGASSRLLRFWLTSDKSGLYLDLYLTATSLVTVHRSVYNTVKNYGSPFLSRAYRDDRWQSIYHSVILERRDVDNANTLEDVKSKIDDGWHQFITQEFPIIRQVIETQIPWNELETSQ